jgi:hypothetical protein
MDAVRVAHKWQSHKKNEPKLVSQIPQKDLKTLSKEKLILSITIQIRARTHQIPIPKHIINPIHRWPKFIFSQTRRHTIETPIVISSKLMCFYYFFRVGVCFSLPEIGITIFGHSFLK